MVIEFGRFSRQFVFLAISLLILAGSVSLKPLRALGIVVGLACAGDGGEPVGGFVALAVESLRTGAGSVGGVGDASLSGGACDWGNVGVS
jgi:hypothetical protein